ncbi:hypothetical protein D3C71_2113850 [compost metagenome]
MVGEESGVDEFAAGFLAIQLIRTFQRERNVRVLFVLDAAEDRFGQAKVEAGIQGPVQIGGDQRRRRVPYLSDKVGVRIDFV